MDLQSKYQPCETHSFQSQASSLPALKLRSFLGLPSQTLLGALPQTPPGTLSLDPSSLRACLKQFFLIFLYFSRFSVPDSTR